MLTTQDKILIEQRITNDKPSTGVAYLLLIFLGVLGAHRFYLERTGSAIAMLLISLNFIGLIVTAVWALIDLFLVPSMVREKVEGLRQKLTTEALSSAPNPQAV